MVFFTGEWELEPGGAGYLTVFEAVSYGPPWNGWMTPVVTESVLLRMVWRQNQLRANETSRHGPIDVPPKLSLAGDSLLISYDDPDYPPRRIRRDARGLYDLYDLAWTFEDVHPSRAIHVVRRDADLWTDHLSEHLVRRVEHDGLPFYWARRIRDRAIRDWSSGPQLSTRPRQPPSGPGAPSDLSL